MPFVIAWSWLHRASRFFSPGQGHHLDLGLDQFSGFLTFPLFTIPFVPLARDFIYETLTSLDAFVPASPQSSHRFFH